MLLKSISHLNKTERYLLKAEKVYVPMFAQPVYRMTNKDVVNCINAQRSELVDYIELFKSVYRDHSRIDDPLYYLKAQEGVSFVFADYQKEIAVPLGFNSFELQKFDGEEYIYIARIENFFKDTHKGIGRATIALAAEYYFTLYPDAQDEQVALKIEADNKTAYEIYRSYGFVDLAGTQLMTVEGARFFLEEYNQYLKDVFQGD